MHSSNIRGSATRRGFTLLEVLIAITIIGVLVAFLMSATGKTRLSAASASCVGNLRILAVAHAAYRAEHNGRNVPYTTTIEGHTAFGIALLRQYYLPGPYYVWQGGFLLPTPKTEICPVVMLRPDLDGNGKYSDYGFLPHNDTVNLSTLPDQSKIPILFDGWDTGWKSSVPLRHLNFNGINAAFLDGHVESISQSIDDGRLYWTWWSAALLQLNTSEANLGKGQKVGSLTP